MAQQAILKGPSKLSVMFLWDASCHTIKTLDTSLSFERLLMLANETRKPFRLRRWGLLLRVLLPAELALGAVHC